VSVTLGGVCAAESDRFDSELIVSKRFVRVSVS
jgi:hypothetical protein